MSDVDVAVIGDLNPDLVLAAPDLQVGFGQRETLVDRADLRLGGSAAITACAAASLGLRVAFCGLVGDDAYGRFCVDELTRYGVDVRAVRVDRDVTTGVTVILQRDGDRAIITHQGSIAELAVGHLDREILAGARHVHVGSYFLLDALRPELPRLFEELRATGTTTSLDTNDDPRGVFDVHDLIDMCDVLLPNDAEAQRITGAATTDDAVAELATRAGTVAATTGAGAVARRGDEVVRVGSPPVDRATIVDSIGAGDNFDAGFLYGYVNGWDLERCVRAGLDAAGQSLHGPGGTGALTPHRDGADG